MAGRKGLLLERSSATAFRRREALGLLAGAAAPWPRPARADFALLDETVGFTGQILFLTLKVPALVIGVVRNGETSIYGFGRRAAGSDAEPDGATVFRIGSITKAFTGQVLASLAAEGKVGLADPLAKFVPEFAQGTGGERPIRLIDLATHSAGLPREVPHAPGPPDDPFRNITKAAFAAWLKANPLLFPPGTAVSYSNFGFDLLVAALSAAAGKPYPNLLAERVLIPLGLSDTSFAPAADQASRLMQGHGFNGEPLPLVPTGDVIVGSGGLYSTPRDLVRWLAWHLDRFGNDGFDERLIDHAAYLRRDGLTSVLGLDELGRMRHAMSSVVGRMALSINENHLPPLTPLSSADVMRSVQIEASAQSQRGSRASDPHAHPIDVALDDLSAAERADPLVRRAHRRRQGLDEEDHGRRPGAQAAGGPVALRRGRGRSRGRASGRSVRAIKTSMDTSTQGSGDRAMLTSATLQGGQDAVPGCGSKTPPSRLVLPPWFPTWPLTQRASWSGARPEPSAAGYELVRPCVASSRGEPPWIGCRPSPSKSLASSQRTGGPSKRRRPRAGSASGQETRDERQPASTSWTILFRA